MEGATCCTLLGVNNVPHSSPNAMNPNRGKTLALTVSALFAGLVLGLPVVYGRCVESFFSLWMLPSWTVLVFAVFAAKSRFPLMSVLVCLLWAPMHYALVTEPCTPPRSQGAGGFIYLLALAALPLVLAGGALLGRLLHFLGAFCKGLPHFRQR